MLAIFQTLYYNIWVNAGVMELVDVADSKSAAGDSVPVRLRSPAPRKAPMNVMFIGAFFVFPDGGGKACRIWENGD